MVNAKKAYDRILDDSSTSAASFPSEFFSRDDMERLSKLGSLKK